MYEIEKITAAGILTLLAVCDVRRKRVPHMGLIALLAAAVIYRICGGGTIRSWILGVLPGAFFFLMSYLTEEGIGYGDSYVILILGIYLGAWNATAICLTALFLMALFAMAGMALWRWKKTKRLPFIPFLAAGCLGVMLW